MDNGEMDEARVVREVKRVQTLCKFYPECIEGVEKDCKHAMCVLAGLYDEIVDLKENNAYTNIVGQIEMILRDCSGNEGVGSCGNALMVASQFLHRGHGDLTEKPLTREDFLDFLGRRREITDTELPLEPGSAEVKPITYEVQKGYVPGKDEHMMLYHR